MCRLPKFLVGVVLALFCVQDVCCGQGTITIGFEGPAYPGGPQPQPPGTYSIMNQYSESGMLFRIPHHPDSLLLIGSGGSPDNGTAYLGTLLNTTVVANFPLGTSFSVTSIDAAWLPLAGQLQVVGYRRDGTTVTNNFIPGQLSVFQTFNFTPGFVNLDRIEIRGGYDLDNLVVGIPEPPGGVLMLVGTITGLRWVRSTMKRESFRRSAR